MNKQVSLKSGTNTGQSDFGTYGFHLGAIMKSVIIALLISLSFIMTAFAQEGARMPNGPEPDRPGFRGPGRHFEQRKAEILKNIDERLKRLQQMRDCIQASHSHEDARSCREKFGPPHGPDGEQPGWPAGPGDSRK